MQGKRRGIKSKKCSVSNNAVCLFPPNARKNLVGIDKYKSTDFTCQFLGSRTDSGEKPFNFLMYFHRCGTVYFQCPLSVEWHIDNKHIDIGNPGKQSKPVWSKNSNRIVLHVFFMNRSFYFQL
jgi:hypothetical protein